jgi:uncharacterized protein
VRRFALALIGAYQRWISPRKGFHCAYRVHCGGAGCSAVGARLIRRHGLWAGLPLLRERLRRCGAVHAHAPARRPLAAQRGDCDIGCIDLPDLDCDGPGRWRLCDAADCCSACDWPSRERKKLQPRRHGSDTKVTRRFHTR